jgi:GNAT superfamily N-acetyltransferase
VTDGDWAACAAVWDVVTPAEPLDVALARTRAAREPRRLYVLAEREGALVGCGYGGPSQTEGRGFVSPRVVPGRRREGVGTAVLVHLCEHLERAGFALASALVDGNDPEAVAFAEHVGFEIVDRQVEQVRVLGDEAGAEPPHDVVFTTVAERPELLGEAYPLAEQGYADLATVDAVTVSLEEWLEEEATIPEASLVALVDGEIVAYSGLNRVGDAGAEDGLTVVRRDRRRQGLALALKRAKLARAAALGITEITTWTQERNAAMRAVNEQLGYRYRDVVLSVRAPLPLRER